MKKLLFPCLILGLLLAAPAAKARAAEIEDLLPESAVLLVKATDWSRTRKDLDETAIGKILAEEDVKEYLKGLKEVIDQLLVQMEQATGVKKEDFQAAYGTEIALAFMGFGEADAKGQAGARLRANKAAAIACCWGYATAQAMFKRNDWDGNGVLEYAADFTKLNTTPDGAGNPIQLIDDAFAKAGPGGEPKSGYRFHSITSIGGAVIDRVNDYALCAVPAEYGKTGTQTFILCTDGTAFSKDTGGKPVLDYPVNPAAAGWVVAEFGGGGGAAPPLFSAGIFAKVGDEEAAGRINATIEKMLSTLPGADARPFDWGAVKGTGYGDETAMIYVFRAGAWQAWVFATGEKPVKELAAAMAAGKNPKPLSESEDYQLCCAKLTERTDFVWYLGVEKGLKQALPLIPEEERAGIKAVLDALHVEDLIAAAGSVAVEPPGFRARSFLACGQTEGGVLELVGTDPLPAEFLKIVPGNAVALQAFGVRPGKVLPLVRSILIAADPEAAARELDQGLAQAKEELGFDIEKDLLGALGDRLCVYALPASAAGGNPMLGGLNGLALAWEVKDPEALRGAVDKIVAMAGAMMPAGPDAAEEVISTFDYRGQKVTAFNLQMAAPGFAVTDKYLLLGANVQTVKKAIARLADPAKAGPALVDSEKYKQAMARLQADGACSLSFLDTGSSVTSTMAMTGMMAGMMLPAMGKVRANAQSAKSKSNLRNLALGCMLWADEHDDKFPPDLKSLVPEYIDNPKVFECPGYGKHAADKIDYAYVSGLSWDDDGRTPLAYETIPDARGRVNVAFTDGHVELITPDELEKQMKEWHGKLIKAGRKIAITEPAGVERGGGVELDPAVLGPETLLALARQLGNPATMPPAECISKHLFPVVSATRKVEGGILSESFSPLGIAGGLGGGGDSTTAVAGVAIVAAIAIPSLLAARRNAQEFSAIACCRAYAASQTMYKRNDWDGDAMLEYAVPYSLLHNQPDAMGNKVMLIDAAFAGAQSADGVPKAGYLFQDMTSIGGVKLADANGNWTTDYAICAIPAQYGKTGYRSFIICTDGTVYGRDQGVGGGFITDYPADPMMAGWIIAE